MPSPIAHIAAGSLVAWAAKSFSSRIPKSAGLWAACILLSLAPDLDLIPAFATGDIAHYHNQWTHSLVFGLGFSLLAGALLTKCWRINYFRCFVISLACYYLHIGLDLVTPGRGIRLLWPFSDARLCVTPPLFYGVRWSEGFISHHHLITLASELLIVSALFGVIWLLAKLLKRPGRDA